MARPRKPTRVLELSGAFKQHPERRRAAEPQPTGPIGEPPARLYTKAIPFWDEIVTQCAPGVLTVADRWAVELASRIMLKVAIGSVKGCELGVLRSLLSSMGMTPADRTRLSIPPANRFLAHKAESKSLN